MYVLHILLWQCSEFYVIIRKWIEQSESLNSQVSELKKLIEYE